MASKENRRRADDGGSDKTGTERESVCDSSTSTINGAFYSSRKQGEPQQAPKTKMRMADKRAKLTMTHRQPSRARKRSKRVRLESNENGV